MQLIVLRHGPTEWNERGWLQGRADLPLSESGRRLVLAWSLPATWRKLPCSVSPLRRARQTAELLGLQECCAVAQLIEMDWGDFEGQHLADLRARLGQAMVRNEARGLDFRPPGGESPRDVTRRLRGWLDRLGPLADERLVVTHKGVRRALLAMATGWEMQRPPPVKVGDDDAMVLDLDGAGRLTLTATLKLGPAP